MFVDSLPGNLNQPFFHIGGKGSRAQDVKVKLHCGADFVDVLSTGSGGANGCKTEFFRGDRNERAVFVHFPEYTLKQMSALAGAHSVDAIRED